MKLLVVVLLLCCTGVAAQNVGVLPEEGANRLPANGVVVQSIDRNTSPWIAHVVNLSHKYVTAVNFGITTTSKEGHVGFSDDTHQFGATDFAPGTTKDLAIGSYSPDAKVVLDVVVYGDLTAESSNNRALQSIVESRQRGLLTEQKISDVIAKSTTPEEAAAELEKLAAATPEIRHEHTLDLYPSMLRFAAEALRSGTDPKEILKRNTASINTHQHDAEIKKVN